MRINIRRLTLVSIILVVALTVSCLPGQGWSNGGYSADPDDPDYGTHDWIADEALGLQAKDVSHFETTYHNAYLIGTEVPDNPAYIGDYWSHHIYYYSDRSLQDDAAADRAKAMYDSALTRLVEGDFEAAAYYMGAMTHYISDVGVFGHTMDDSTDWGEEVHHSDYESHFESILSSLALPATITLGKSTAYDAASGLADTITFGSGPIKPNTWMDDYYSWSDDVFETSAMESLFKAVWASAAAINHLLTAAEPAPEEPPSELDVPGPPASLEAYAESSHIALVWSPPASDGGSPIIEYMIYRGYDPGSRNLVATLPGYAQTWEDRAAEREVTYYYWVAARNSIGIGGLSEVASTTLEGPESSESLFWPALFSTVVAALASGGVVLWWRKVRRRPET